MKKTQGFTLIELLVVIAIIGILSSIVIASLNSARSKGKDAAVKGQMQQLRTAAEDYYDNNGQKYSLAAVTTCTAANSMFSSASSTIISKQITLIAANDSSTSVMACYINSTGQNWAVSISGLSSNPTSYCVDNSGNTKASSTAQSTGICS